MEEVDQLVPGWPRSRYRECVQQRRLGAGADVRAPELEKVITLLDEDIRRIERENRISYMSAEKRLSLG